MSAHPADAAPTPLTAKRQASQLTQVLYNLGAHHFGIPTLNLRRPLPAPPLSRSEASLRTLLQSPNLSTETAQKCFAHAMDALLSDYITVRYGNVSLTAAVLRPRSPELRKWVAVTLAPFVRRVLGVILGVGNEKGEEMFGAEEVREWQGMAVERLGRVRVGQMFDVVVGWPGTRGLVLDVKQYATTTSTRLHVTTAFTKQVKARLLHCGVSTPRILDVYISAIQAFKVLDPKGVLLHRVAEPIKKYLRTRDDVSKVLIASYLADLDNLDEGGNHISLGDDVCERAAEQLQHEDAEGEAAEEVNFKIDWVPDPIDAVPGYKESRYGDVTSYLLNLFDTDQSFVRELQTLLAEHLLKNDDTEFVRERTLVQKLSVRFGKTALQACGVMLHDLSQSLHVSRKVRRESVLPDTPLYEKQILSRMYWPPLRSESFNLPTQIQELGERYVRSYERIHHMRVLEDVPALGRVSVELEFEDRFVVEDNIYPWQATVIYAFGETGPTRDLLPTTKRVGDLQQELAMDETLVRTALLFWVGKGVLRESAPDTYTVIEKRSATDNSTEAAAVAAAAAEAAEASGAASSMKSAEQVKMEHMAIYEKGVVAMLTNQGAMQLGRIAMMLKMLVPDGGGFGELELREFLQRLVEEGRVERSGADMYRIAPGQVGM